MTHPRQLRPSPTSMELFSIFGNDVNETTTSSSLAMRAGVRFVKSYYLQVPIRDRAFVKI
ncbi:hypothetical protein TorRG33x02_271760 [Trema orientale]|uniref:Uncharacterized protein n=1 Tax=Trema orientale TaxID=63057 RepID=A0A2P5CVR3_TREOI|nr:hypothetical protein TorRG33x02_271760 [Trema orientale]